MRHTILCFFSLLLFAVPNIYGQESHRSLGPYTMFEDAIYQSKQEEILTYIAHDYAEGRETGTNASQMIAKFISDRFREYGLDYYKGKSFFRPFMADSATRARNVVGIVKSTVPSDEYVIISAHYDNIGKINGAIYNGADKNASGVTALINLAEMFGSMGKAKLGPNKNIIFAALDGTEYNMAGAKHFIEDLNIDKRKIICDINIDQIGTVLEPVNDNDTNFVIVLGEKTLRPEHRGLIKMCNNYYNINLDIDYTFYGSKNFTELYYQLSDQIVFHKAGIPALIFTSGFHRYTNKTTDDPNIISYPVLKKRTVLIFYLTLML